MTLALWFIVIFAAFVAVALALPANLSIEVRDEPAGKDALAPPAGEGKPTLTYPPEPHSWVAVKGDKPTVVVEKAAYDDLRARFVALRKKT